MREVALHDNNDDASAFSADSSNSAGTGLYSNDDLDSSVDGDSQAPSSSREELKIAQSEGKFVLCSKFVAYLVLFLSAVAAGIATYHFTRDQEMSEFEDDVSVVMMKYNAYCCFVVLNELLSCLLRDQNHRSRLLVYEFLIG